MFVLQPLFGKLLLPLLGGSSGGMEYLYGVLPKHPFLGYLLCASISTRFDQRRQIQIHAAVYANQLSWPCLSPCLKTSRRLLTPIRHFGLFWTLFLAIGLPFFVFQPQRPFGTKMVCQCRPPYQHDPYYSLCRQQHRQSGSPCSVYPFFAGTGYRLGSSKNGLEHRLLICVC